MTELCKRATPGPFRLSGYRDVVGKGEFGDVVVAREVDSSPGDADFFIHARTDLPRLLDEVAALKDENKVFASRITELETALRKIANGWTLNERDMQLIANEALEGEG